MAKTKSQFFRAFVAGQTVSDGRQISPEMIDQIVETFNAETYSPRVNIEHIAGYSPEPPFNGYGDVVAVRAQDDDIVVAGKTEKRRALYCQVDGNDQLVTLAGRDQKPFPSVEITDSYAGTGKVGLVGLAFTDTPASIATQRLQFARAVGASIVTATDRAGDFKFDAPVDDAQGFAAQFKAMFTAMFKSAEPEAKPDPEPKPKPAANDNVDVAAMATQLAGTFSTALSAALAPIADAQARQAAEFARLKSDVENTAKPGGFSRAPATGGDGKAVIQTDC